MVETTDLGKLEEKIDILTNLLAYIVIDDMNISEAAPVLKRLGMRNVDIAVVTGSTAKAVGTRISEAKKK